MADKTERLNVRLSKEDMETLKEAAILFDMSLADYIRLVALRPARAYLTNDMSVVSATAELQERYLENALKLRKSASKKDEVSDDKT